MDDEGKREQTRHEDESVREPLNENSNGEQKGDEKTPEEAFMMGCLEKIFLTVVLGILSIYLVCR